MPPQILFAAGAYLFILVTLDREDVVHQVAVLLRGPGERIAEQTGVENKNDLLFERGFGIKPPFPVRRSLADSGVVDGIS